MVRFAKKGELFIRVYDCIVWMVHTRVAIVARPRIRTESFNGQGYEFGVSIHLNC